MKELFAFDTLGTVGSHMCDVCVFRFIIIRRKQMCIAYAVYNIMFCVENVERWTRYKPQTRQKNKTDKHTINMCAWVRWVWWRHRIINFFFQKKVDLVLLFTRKFCAIDFECAAKNTETKI